ncbi:Dynamitin-domain-containing protein, partial [Globomyces pollinis-pini]
KHQKDIELEARITNLERIVGLHALDPIDSVLSKEDGQSLFSTSGTLIGSLERIDHHLVLLTQPEVLAESLKRVKEATASLETLIDLRRKQKIEASISNQSQSTVTLEKQINYLYEKMTRLEPIGNMIPNILLRLKALQSLHTEVAQTVEKLQILTEDQEKLKKVTSNNSQGLSLLQKTLAKDQSQITDNIAALDTRINDLLTKINKNNR